MLFLTDMLDDDHKEDTHSLGKAKFKSIMCGEFEGGIKLTDEEKHNKIKFYEKQGFVKIYSELNNINNDELADRASKCYSLC